MEVLEMKAADIEDSTWFQQQTGCSRGEGQ